MASGRGWHYWSRNKLDILAKYMHAFNVASKSSSERIYLDLMAGQPENVDAVTGEPFDGSARLAMATEPPFTRLAFGEMPARARAIQADLSQRYPGGPFKVYTGDCNRTIHQMLADLAPVNWAPTFAFLDQQSAELRWETMQAIASFRRGKTKAEQWILWSPSMLIRNLKGTSDPLARRVDALYGNTRWHPIWRARHNDEIDAETFRAEMTNLVRWQLETELGYRHTARIPMKTHTNVEIYDMVFATDHAVGIKIMSDLYAKAWEREPEMRLEAMEAMKAPSRWSEESLFDMEPTSPEAPKWRSEPCWDPTERWGAR